MASESAIRAVNALTARWADTFTPAQGTVFTAAGLWPLLALLADGADHPARRELADALGLPPESPAAEARALLDAMGTMPGVGAALGLWTRHELPLEPAWATALPPHVHQLLSGDPVPDQARLDEWARTRTDGQVDAMPTTLDDTTLLVLASALTVRTDWIKPFQRCRIRATSGPWRGRDILGLSRASEQLDQIAVVGASSGRVTVLRVLGTEGVDVHLALGEPDGSPGAVLTAAIGALGRPDSVMPGDRFPDGTPGPGLTVESITSRSDGDRLMVSTIPFTVTARHNLLDHRPLFGLTTATDPSEGRFSGISRVPLAVQAAMQAMTATFGELGFRSSAVTGLGLFGGSAPRLRTRVREVRVTFDRPFGFLAVHRSSHLVLNAGWVSDPVDHFAGWSRSRPRT